MERYSKKGNGILCERSPVKYAWIQSYQADYPIGMMCQLLKVSRNAYYHWLKYGERKEDEDLIILVKEVFYDSFKTYGTRRIKHHLKSNMDGLPHEEGLHTELFTVPVAVFGGLKQSALSGSYLKPPALPEVVTYLIFIGKG